MAEPKLLLSDEEYAAIKIRAAKSGLKPQDLMRDAVRSMMASGQPVAAPALIGPAASDVVQKLYSLEAKTGELLSSIQDAAKHLKEIIDDDARSNITYAGDAARRPGVDEGVLSQVDAAIERARGAVRSSAPPDSGPEGTDTGTAGPRVGPKKRR